MTTRAVIETAARAWHDATCPEGPECRDRRLHADPHSIPVMGQLVDVLDAVLPQITTWEELRALHGWSTVMDSSGNAWRAEDVLAATSGAVGIPGPLTVVWQPQPEQETRTDD